MSLKTWVKGWINKVLKKTPEEQPKIGTLSTEDIKKMEKAEECCGTDCCQESTTPTRPVVNVQRPRR